MKTFNAKNVVLIIDGKAVRSYPDNAEITFGSWTKFAVKPKIKRGMKRRPNKRKKQAMKLNRGIWS